MNLRAASIATLGLCVLAPAGRAQAQSAAAVNAYIVAHPDDWQLFMGDVAFRQVAAGQRVVFVHLTSGGADRPAEYWRARERGAAASAFAAANAGRRTPVEGAERTCATVTVRGHRVARCVYRNTVSYHLRLPDGNIDGSGFVISKSQALVKLRTAQMHMEAVDSSTTYESWDDLRATVRAILERESSQAAGRLRLHSSDPDSTRNKGDHSDHLNTGLLTAEVAGPLNARLTHYIGYDIRNRPPNLAAAAASAKSLLFMAYERQRLQADEKWSAYAEAPGLYSSWLFRTYSRSIASR